MRGKISPALKQKAVMEIESGRLSQSEAARRLCVDGETVRSWLTTYRSEGNAGLECCSKNRIYSVQTKHQAVEAYLTGQYSLQKICEIFKHRLTRAHRGKQLKMSCQALHNAPPNRT